VTTNQRIANEQRHEIDLFALLRVVLGHKRVVGVTVVLCGALAAYVAITAIPIFRAEVLVTPAREQDAGGLSSLASQYGGLASLAGVNLGDSAQERERQAMLLSRRLVEEFVKRADVWPLLLRGAKKKPTLWLAVLKFRRNVLTINEDKIKGTTSISMDWTDPAIAARWANEFVAMANELVRNRAIDESTRNIKYLNEQIARTTVLEVQHVMYDLIERETKTLMLANARIEYAFTIVDPAVAPEVRISPKRTFMVLGGLVVGLLIGGMLALAYDRFGARRGGETRVTDPAHNPAQ
jgi:uncharacterized protein involved in exopolysaccharide biosynthesis